MVREEVTALVASFLRAANADEGYQRSKLSVTESQREQSSALLFYLLFADRSTPAYIGQQKLDECN